MKLLIVDDHSGMREMIRDVVGHTATQVLECASGEEAIALCQAHSPDCVTMDLRLGVMHGLTALQRIRTEQPAINIVVVTQFDQQILRDRAQRSGADGFFTKDDLAPLKRYVELLSSTFNDEDE